MTEKFTTTFCQKLVFSKDLTFSYNQFARLATSKNEFSEQLSFEWYMTYACNMSCQRIYIRHPTNAGSLPGSTSSSSNSSLNLSDCSNSGDKQAQPESAKGKRKAGASLDILEFMRDESAKKEKWHEERLSIANRLVDILEKKL